MHDLSYPASTAHRRRRRMSRGVLMAIVALAALALASIMFLVATFVVGGSGPAAEVGDCVTQSTEIATVDCADPKAAYKVVAVIDGTRGQAQANDETHPCAKFEDAITSLWSGEPGDKGPQPTDPGTIFCLRPAK